MVDATFVGIDLGTANCCLAYTNGDGEVSILKYDEVDDIMPSVVTFTEEGIYVGKEGMEHGHIKGSWNTVSHFKRVMGEDVYRTYNGVKYTPTELSSLVLTKMMRRFKEVTGKDITKAVITIPSDYGDVERHSTFNAAKIAGIEEIFLLSESLAAAIDYGTKYCNEGNRNIMIYDLGTGTLDVAVVNVSDGRFKVLADESNKDIGGRDWDLQLASIIQKKVLDSLGMDSSDVISDNEFRRDVMNVTDDVKIRLETAVKVESTVKLNGNDVEFTVSREDFEESTSWLMAKTIEMMGHAIRDADMNMSDIDTIVLVGGSSMMLQVPKGISEAFPSSEIVMFKPQYAIARGASIYAESLFGKESKIEAIPVMTKTYGFMVGIDGMEKICNVVYKNSPIPSEVKLICRPKRDDQEELELKIYESLSKKGEVYIDDADAKLVKIFKVPLKGKISRGRTKIPIRIHTNEHGKVRFFVECNGEESVLTFIDEIQLTPDEIMESRRKTEAVI